MSRTAPSRTAFSPQLRWLVFSACYLLLLVACSGNDPAVRPAADAGTDQLESSTTSLPPADGNLLTPNSSEPRTDESAEPATLGELAGQIVSRTANGDLVITAPDGSNSNVLASGATSRNTQPTWSNSGDRVVWTTQDTNSAQLVVASVGGLANGSDTPPSTITAEMDTPVFYMAWSPNDTWIAGLRQGPAGIELIIIDAETADVRVVGPGQPFFSDWIDDNTLLAAIGGVVLADIVADGSGAEQRNVTQPLGAFQAPAALSNGDAIVALDNGLGAAGDRENVVSRLEGTSATALGVAKSPVLMAVNPEGTRVAVIVAGDPTQSEVISFQQAPSPELPVGQVSIIDLTTGEVNVRPETQIAALNWSPDGQTLALLQLGDSAATWLFVTNETVIEGTPFIPSQELASAYLPFSDQYERSSTWWSPNSLAFVVAGVVDGEAGIWVDRIDDDAPAVRIGSGDIAFWSPK